MDELLLDQLEWLLAQNGSNVRYERQIITLVGFLSDEQLPDAISQQIRALSKQVTLRDIFDALVASLSSFAPARPRARMDGKIDGEINVDLTPLVTQIEAARLALSQCEAVSHAELIAWVVSKAKQRKLWQGRRGRR